MLRLCRHKNRTRCCSAVKLDFDLNLNPWKVPKNHHRVSYLSLSFSAWLCVDPDVDSNEASQSTWAQTLVSVCGCVGGSWCTRSLRPLQTDCPDGGFRNTVLNPTQTQQALINARTQKHTQGPPEGVKGHLNKMPDWSDLPESFSQSEAP